MTAFEMRNFDPPEYPGDTEMSAQERLLFNNNYNSNHNHNNNLNHGHPQQHPHPILDPQNGILLQGGGGGGGSEVGIPGQEENHYQIPYAHLHQHHLLQQQQQQQQQQQNNHHQQQMPYHHLQPQGMYNSDDLLHANSTNSHSSINNGHSNGLSGYVDKYSMAYPERHHDGTWRTNRSNGSGVVYRPRKKGWWLAMVLILLLIIAGAVVIALYFTVLKNEPMTSSNSSSDADGGVVETNDLNNNNNNNNNYNNNGNDDNTDDDGPDWNDNGYGNSFGGVDRDPPIDPFFPSSSTTPKTPHIIDVSGMDLEKFNAFWHPGDSRLFAAKFVDGPTVHAFGPKKSDGTAKALYSMSLTDVDGISKSVRFLGQRNLASVILSNGVIVQYDWSETTNNNMEVKIFQPDRSPQNSRRRRRRAPNNPISHLAVVDVGARSYVLRTISKTNSVHQEKMPSFMPSRRGASSTKCFSRFPVKVTKCGSEYLYDGAFVQGQITGIENLHEPLMMTALPWPKDNEKDDDPCYKRDHRLDHGSNYYLPLPGKVDRDNATMIKDAFTASSASLFTYLCANINKTLASSEGRHDLCSELATKVMKSLNREHLLHIVYESCSTMLNALHVGCSAIVNITSSAPSSHASSSSSSSAAAAEKKPVAFTERGVMDSLNRHLSNSFPEELPSNVQLQAFSYCPSDPDSPKMSYETNVPITAISGRSSNIINDLIHINCPGYPEVVSVRLHHLLHQARDSYSVKHRMRVCSMCAFEKDISAHVVSDDMLCNNTCTETNNAVERDHRRHDTERHTFDQQDSVYCHDFLTSVDNPMDTLQPGCRGNCMSHLHVEFRINDPRSDTIYYDQTVQCSELRSHECKMSFGR